jgi:hypothetical protein
MGVIRNLQTSLVIVQAYWLWARIRRGKGWKIFKTKATAARQEPGNVFVLVRMDLEAAVEEQFAALALDPTMGWF